MPGVKTALVPFLAVLGACVSSPVLAQIAPTAAFHISGDEVVMPLVLVDEFPFVEAEVNGAHGKLMFDTGAKSALTLNSRRVPLDPGKQAGTGFFGSGETFTIMRHDRVGPISIGDLNFDAATNVTSQNARQLEGITPDFIGWLGYDFFDGYAAKFDYDALTVTLYKDGPYTSERYLKGETVVAVIDFETRNLPNHPIVSGQIGSQSVEIAFDTGQYGSIFSTPEIQAGLVAEGRLHPVEVADETRADMTGLTLNQGAVSLNVRVNLAEGPFPASKPLGLTAPDGRHAGIQCTEPVQDRVGLRPKEIIPARTIRHAASGRRANGRLALRHQMRYRQ